MTGTLRRRKSDRRTRHVTWWTGITMLVISPILPIITFAGYTWIWIIDVKRKLAGLPHIDLPGPPWDTWEAVGASLALALVGSYLKTATDTQTEGARIAKGLTSIFVRRGERAVVEGPTSIEVEEDAPPPDEGG